MAANSAHYKSQFGRKDLWNFGRFIAREKCVGVKSLFAIICARSFGSFLKEEFPSAILQQCGTAPNERIPLGLVLLAAQHIRAQEDGKAALVLGVECRHPAHQFKGSQRNAQLGQCHVQFGAVESQPFRLVRTAQFGINTGEEQPDQVVQARP